ncbi:transcriptional regulator [Campylobacter cuniculorum]|uniref:Uncharacterized protein n=2 Tax=Campylobacter cuniculorum TaxID=374106 RepID=A0A1W6BV40_9BACT|nr:transcriptional regulator [Campylobacter cuniculorum]ARJ55948.1 hypothetical protein CCUN_0293 [Campylobacter cuniculorum DSM 23162 = LMG 24588]QOR05167.1 transcriptional regulator [Campylobacter cuniculorum]
MSKYLLKNKDKIILEFEVIEENETLNGQTIKYFSLAHVNIIQKELLPKAIQTKNILTSLESWIKQRKIPKHRNFAHNILSSISMDSENNLMSYIDVSFGLSLNDSFWIVPNDKNYQWKDYNLYENEFSEALALSAFGLKMTKINGFTSSPEFTTNGMLKKCWHRENKQIYLYKGNSEESNDGTEYGGKEAYSEYYMAQIAQIMEFECVPYDLKLFHNELVSVCPIFTNENEGFMPIHVLLKKSLREYNKIEMMREISVLYGQDSFNDLMLFDALICNIDRHLGNFGMMIDNNTNEILRPAPIFDNGMSFISTLGKNELNYINECLAKDMSYFELRFDEQLKLFVQERHKENLEKLTDFSFKRHSQFNLSEEWLIPIENCIRTRAKRALEFIEEKCKAIQKSQDSLHPKDSQETENNAVTKDSQITTSKQIKRKR